MGVVCAKQFLTYLGLLAAQVVGTTHRYKSKYVTTVMYKPKHRRQKSSHEGMQQEGMSVYD